MEAIRSINDDQLSGGFLVTVYFFLSWKPISWQARCLWRMGSVGRTCIRFDMRMWRNFERFDLPFSLQLFFALDRWWFLKDAWHFGDFGNVRNVFWCSYISQSGNRGVFAYPTLWKYSKWKEHTHGTQPVMGCRSWFSVSKSGRVFRGCTLSLFPMV